MRRVHYGLLAAVAVLGFTSAASAADLPVKAPVYKAAVAVAPSWAGFYIGANVGGDWATDNTTWIANTAGFGAGPFTTALNAAGTGSIHAAGATVGGQIGFNYQAYDVVVWGAEADINYTGLSKSRSVAVAPPAVLGTVVTSSFESKWLATVRGRIGFLPTPNLLLYGTGGVAFAEVKTSDFAFFALDGSNNAASSSRTKTGWTLGGGAEWAYGSNWSAKIEYLYVDLGNVNYTSPNNLTVLATINHSHSITENIVRVGLNYRFH